MKSESCRADLHSKGMGDVRWTVMKMARKMDKSGMRSQREGKREGGRGMGVVFVGAVIIVTEPGRVTWYRQRGNAPRRDFGPTTLREPNTRAGDSEVTCLVGEESGRAATTGRTGGRQKMPPSSASPCPPGSCSPSYLF